MGGVASSFSVFGWEWWGPLVLVSAGAAGLLAGGVGAVRGTVIGGLVGAAPLGVYFAWAAASASTAGELPPNDSWGIPVWGTVAVVVAAFVAAAVSSLIARARYPDTGSTG